MGYTTSERHITAPTTPEALCVSKTWSQWLAKYIPYDVYKKLNNDTVAKFRMELLFAIAAPVPRAVQYVVVEAQEYFHTLGDSNNNMLKSSALKHLKRFTQNHMIYWRKSTVVCVTLLCYQSTCGRFY